MKNKLPKDPFDTACWGGKDIIDPHQVLAEAFNCMDIEALRREIKQIVSYAQEDKLYKDHSPYDVLLGMKIVRSLLKASYALKDEKGSPIAVSENDTINRHYYCSSHSKANLWSDFPRCLSRDEFCNPYRVLKRFFKKQPLSKWIRSWEEMVECALDYYASGTELNVLQFYIWLVKLVEAAHLIDVRENTK